MGIRIVASAPGRCGILGNPSDIYGGSVLSCSIPARARCEVVLESEPANGAAQLPSDTTLWDAVAARFPVGDALTSVQWQTTIPRSSGLAGSTALLAATLLCVLAARQESPDLSAPGAKESVAELVRDVERNTANVACGFQDAYMTVFGGLHLMDFAGKHPLNPGPNATLKPISAPVPFLLITTGVERLSGSVHGPMIQRWLNGDRAVVEAISTISTMAPAGAAALMAGRYVELGAAMDENHKLIASLGGSGEPVEQLIAHCRASGAISAKLAGAGMGGTVIALTEEPEALADRLRQRGYSQFLRPEIVSGLEICS